MKDLLVKMLKAFFEALFKVIVEAVKNVDWKKVAHEAYQSYRPTLVEKAESTEGKVDDAVVKALDVLDEKFLKPEEKNA